MRFAELNAREMSQGRPAMPNNLAARRNYGVRQKSKEEQADHRAGHLHKLNAANSGDNQWSF